MTIIQDHPGGAGTSPARVPDAHPPAAASSGRQRWETQRGPGCGDHGADAGPEPLAPGLGAVPEREVLPGQPGDDRDGREPLADPLDPVDRELRRGEVPSVVQAPAPAPPRTHPCPVCGIRYGLDRAGFLARHGARGNPCPGSYAWLRDGQFIVRGQAVRS